MTMENTSTLRAELERAQMTLKQTLDQACSADLAEANTGELVRLEEVLAIANDAAKDAVSFRRRLSQNASAADDLPGSREVEDDRGVRWLVFVVHPTATTGRPVIREEYRSGWLSFDSGAETRRVAPIPLGWERMPAAELLTLLARAEIARPRRRRSTDELRGEK